MLKKIGLPILAAVVVAAGAYYFVGQRPPATMPPESGIPVYPGAERPEDSFAARLSARDRARLIKAVILKTDDPPDKVINFYKEQLKGKSRLLETKTRGVPTAIFQVEVGGQQKIVSVHADEDSGKTEIFIGTSVPKTELVR
jgi:hypothetical protein